jgi:hypothetical protein
MNDPVSFSKDIQFHNQLNPNLWESDKTLKKEVLSALSNIAEAFVEYLDLPDLNIEDITLSGSNAAYTYTKYSDLDLHIIVNASEKEKVILRKYVDAKKNLFNEQHNITVKGQPVELYVQFVDDPHTSAGVYSIQRDEWVEEPKRIKASINHLDVKSKLREYIRAINRSVQNQDLESANQLMSKLRKYRKEGLSSTGEFGTANLVFKILRNHGYLDKLSDFKIAQLDKELSLKEE